VDYTSRYVFGVPLNGPLFVRPCFCIKRITFFTLRIIYAGSSYVLARCFEIVIRDRKIRSREGRSDSHNNWSNSPRIGISALRMDTTLSGLTLTS
jgi:hypothetical protein